MTAAGEPSPVKAAAPLPIAITGASGFIGRALADAFAARGHRIVRVGRGPAGPDTLSWDIERGVLDPAPLEGLGAVINLAGENIGGRWTPERKRRIRDSRVQGTQLLARTLAGLQRPPAVLLSGSAMGYYGANPGPRPLDESEPPGTDFLAEVSAAWEAAADPARARGIRIVHPRFANVLSPAGGMLARLLPLFRAGLGGRLGPGTQPMSWVSLPDVVGALDFLIHAPAAIGLAGPVNIAAPAPTTNGEFTKALGRALGRPAVLPTPAFALRLAFGGEMAETLLLHGSALVPRRLHEAGFGFVHPTLPVALAALLGVA